ncbi:LOW QUALITY PROTEIN: hypothetical protein ACHAXA_001536 [Cyclostephanos tholiformis]|uniref:Calpain catalytic domain-containing protein n=1 Tax=Cyclostephanos tholiformis TaxID=382380 RepID=A0ABD3RX78_9STRA
MAVLDILSRHEGVIEAIPLVPHRCAATIDGRREGLVFDVEVESGREDDDGDGSWTECDAANILGGGCALYEEYLGLKLHDEDPLPRVMRHCAESGRKRFVDREFPVFPGTVISLAVGGGGEYTHLRPGIITPSNCEDFTSCGGKRARRVSHFASRATEWVWKRASSMMDDDGRGYEIFSSPGSIDPRNVLQGKVGNCGFCSIFASVAACWPENIRDAFGKDSEECMRTCGAYSIRVYLPGGRRRYLLLDDYLLCANEDIDDSPSLHSSISRDLWIRMLEKAYVKLQGSYASLDGYYKLNSLYRHPARALQLLTGVPVALELHFGEGGCYDDNNNRDNVSRDDEVDEAYETLLETQGSYARVAHCRRNIDGLDSNHGYSLLWIEPFYFRTKKTGKAASSRLVCLRNPHGRGPYTGRDFGVGSSLWHEAESAVARRLLIENDCFIRCDSTGRVTWRGSANHSNDASIACEDGIFFMGFASFYRYFPIVTLVGPLTPCHDGHSCGTDCSSSEDLPDCMYSVNLSCMKEILAVCRHGLR